MSLGRSDRRQTVHERRDSGAEALQALGVEVHDLVDVHTDVDRVGDLQRLRVNWKNAAPFVVTSDRNPGVRELERADLRARFSPRETQLPLFG